MKSVDIKSSKFINFISNIFKENNYEDPKFKIGDVVRISKYKKTFTNVYVPIYPE